MSFFHSARKTVDGCISTTKPLDKIHLEETEQNTLTVNGKVVPHSFPENTDEQSEIIVRFKIIVDNIKDEAVCAVAWRYLDRCKFSDRVINDNGSMNEEMERPDPYILHFVGTVNFIDSAFKCVPEKIVASAITLRFDNITENLTENISLATAIGMRVLILEPTIMASLNIPEYTLLADVKVVADVNVGDKKSDVYAICKELLKFPCILRVDIDNWDGTQFKEFLQLIHFRSKVDIILRHEIGHAFALIFNERVNIRIQPSANEKVEAIIKSMMADCPAAQINVAVWILEDAYKRNDCKNILLFLGASVKKIRDFECINFNADGIEFLDTYNEWITINMPDVETLTISVDEATTKQFTRDVLRLEDLKWPKNLGSIGFIIRYPDEELYDSEHSYHIKKCDMPCIKRILPLKDRKGWHFSVKTKKVIPMISPFLHSRECIKESPWLKVKRIAAIQGDKATD